MIGGIYSGQKCPVCGDSFKDNHKDGVVCPKHPEHRATRFIVKFNKTWKRFKSYETANRFLTGLRFKCDEGTYDERDYKKDNPLGFDVLLEKWLGVKEKTVKPGSYRNLANYAGRAIAFLGSRNVKEIGFAELEDFLFSQKVSDKTRANIKSAMHDFWTWLRKRRIIALAQFPEFPECSFELGFRKTISKEEQTAILEEVHRISCHINPKIYLGIKWLCTYISIRPGEMISLKEGNIDVSNGYLTFPYPKEKRPKIVPILEEDVEILRGFPVGVPALPFFRHVKGISGVREGQSFGEKYFYKWWVRACQNLGIEGVDLYGGTRHSSAKALRHYCSPEEIKRATMHVTNKAFERYFQIESDDLREIYSKTKTATVMQPGKLQVKKGNLLKLKG